jgi:hypothetical protein
MKPIGAYDAYDGPDPPTWVTWGKVPEWTVDRRATFRAAAALSARREFTWVLHLGTLGVEANAASTLNDVIDCGLWPHIRGVEFMDEPLSNADAGSYTHLGAQTDRWRRLESAFSWVTDEYAAMEDLYPRRWRRIYSDHLYNADRSFGPQYWRPCPPQAELLQLTSYNLQLLPLFVSHAETTQPRPIMLTPRWFSGPDYGEMTQAIVDAYVPLLARDRVVGACGYHWHVPAPARALGFLGLSDLPAWVDPIAESLGVI